MESALRFKQDVEKALEMFMDGAITSDDVVSMTYTASEKFKNGESE